MLFFTADSTNVSLVIVHALPGVVIVIPGTDPSGVAHKLHVNLIAIGGSDVSETTAVVGAEHDSLVMGKLIRADDEPGSDRGNESDDSTEESEFKSHLFLGSGLVGRGPAFIVGRWFICLEGFPFRVIRALPYMELIKEEVK